MAAPLPPDVARLVALREALPAVSAGIYLNTAAAGPLPAETARVMAEIAEAERRIGRAHPHDPAETIERVGEARAAVAAILASELEAVALTHGTADAIVHVLAATGLRSGDVAIMVEAGSERRLTWPLGLLASAGVEIRRIDVPVDPIEAGRQTGLLEALEAALDGRVRLVVLGHVDGESGQRLPVAEISQLAHTRHAFVILDAGLSMGAIPVSPAALGADAIAFPSERWLLGPAGLGALWTGAALLDQARHARPEAYLDAFSLQPSASPSTARSTSHGAGSLPGHGSESWHRPSVVGLARSCGWLAMQVGMAWAWERGPALAADLAGRLRTIPGLHVRTPPDAMGSVLAFSIAGWPVADARDELGARAFAITGATPSGTALQVSLAAFNSEEELERFADVVALLASHQPGELPPRRTLTVLP